MIASPAGLLALSLLQHGAVRDLNHDGGGEYIYESASDASAQVSVITLNMRDRELVYPGTVTGIEACPDERSNCFKTSRMSFCAPTEAEARRGSWSCGSDQLGFRAKGNVTLRILGKSVEAAVIEGRGVEYFYSRREGVVMFRFVGEQVAEVYWLASPKGFASE
ncbi:MAG: hypothetical protein ACREPD_15530 [Stenotrophomonas sp.]